MEWRVLSWSVVGVPLRPFEPDYGVAIVESDEAERHACHVVRDNVPRLRTGATGSVARSEIAGGEVWEFVPRPDSAEAADRPGGQDSE